MMMMQPMTLLQAAGK